ncbi:GTP cyclohydrolase II [Seohaeicola saemankumensis]|nr:GTP cyclohydrolase II [Seohaeicola saemankumensis]
MNVLQPARMAESSVMSPLAPRAIERLMRVKSDIRLGVPVVLSAKGACAIVVASEVLSAERYAALMNEGGVAEMAMTRHRAIILGLRDLPAADVLWFGIPQNASLGWLAALADPQATPLPIGGGQIDMTPKTHAGDTIHHAAIALAKSAQLLPAVIVLLVADGHAEALRHGLSIIDATEVLTELARERVQFPVSSARLPMSVSEAGRVHVFRPDDGGIEHYAIEIGKPDPSTPVLVRLHSACFTGDVLGSLKCDCGPQLQASCAAMAETGAGILLYLNQEGRGIGLANKMRAYALQDRGLDTVEANHHLGFDDDERDFRIGAALLSRLGVASVKLLTNNPAKVAMLRAQGIDVAERVPLEVGKTKQNAFYLATKAAKSGHLLK